MVLTDPPWTHLFIGLELGGVEEQCCVVWRVVVEVQSTDEWRDLVEDFVSEVMGLAFPRTEHCHPGRQPKLAQQLLL